MVNAVGESVEKGARWGLGGGLLGGVAALGTIGAAGYGAFVGVGALYTAAGAGLWGALAVGAVGLATVAAAPLILAGLAAVVMPAVIALGGTGAALGALSGAKNAGRENARQQAANNYQAGYDQTVSNIKAEMMQAAQAQQQAPAYNSGVQMTGAGVEVMNETPAMQAANYNEAKPQISAATIEHQQQVDAAAKTATIG